MGQRLAYQSVQAVVSLERNYGLWLRLGLGLGFRLGLGLLSLGKYGLGLPFGFLVVLEYLVYRREIIIFILL